VLAKPALDELVELGDVLVEGHHLPGQGVDQLRGGLLPGDGSVLALSGPDGRFGQGPCASDLAVGQPRGQPRAGIALHSDLFALPNRRPSCRGAPGGEAREATRRQPPDSHTQHPWATQPYEWLDQPGEEGRAA
jgi:hypothetical protein